MGLSRRLHLGRRRQPLSRGAGGPGSQPCLALPTPALAPSPVNTLSPPAVRTGNLAKFNQVLDQFGDKFQADGTYTLIIRLRHNVIKTGRRLSLGCLGTPSRPVPGAWRAWGCLDGGLHSRSSRAGVRMISLSYSRISLADIAQKLQLDSPEDAEFIVAKVAAYEVLSLWVPGCPQPPVLAVGLALPPLPSPCSAPCLGQLLVLG